MHKEMESKSRYSAESGRAKIRDRQEGKGAKKEGMATTVCKSVQKEEKRQRKSNKKKGLVSQR